MKIYVAGASAEVDLVRGYMDRLRAAGLTITFDWTALVSSQGGNPRDASREQRAEWATTDLETGIVPADLFWLILPSAPTIGAYIELGFAFGSAIASAFIGRTIASGDTLKSIFTAKCDREFETHEEAFHYIVGLYNFRQEPCP